MKGFCQVALIVAGGIAAGVIVSSLLKRGSLGFKPAAAGLVSRGMDVRDSVKSCLAKVREDCDDIMAEAREAQAARRAAK